MEKIVHLITPGLDSTLTYLYMRYELDVPEKIICLHIPISNLYGQIELNYMLKIFDIFKLFNCEDQFENVPKLMNNHIVTRLEDSSAFFLNRNIILLSIANGLYPNAKIISMGITKYDRVYDTDFDFREYSSKILFNNPKIHSYIEHLNKGELAEWFLKSETINKLFPTAYDRIEFLLNSIYSCYSGGNDECLKCKACFRKNVALYTSMNYVRQFKNKQLINQYLLDSSIPQKRKDLINAYVKAIDLKKKIFKSEEKENDGKQY